MRFVTQNAFFLRSDIGSVMSIPGIQNFIVVNKQKIFYGKSVRF